MEHRTELHDALGESECRCSRLEVVLAEEDRPIGSIDPDQPVRGVLDVTEDGFRELVGEHEVTYARRERRGLSVDSRSNH